MNQRKRADLALGSFLRSQLGWRKDLPAAERAALARRAANIIAAAETGKPDKAFAFDWADWDDFALGSIASRAPFAKIESEALKEMERLAALLPAWGAFGRDTRGFGVRSLAVIVGEAGDLSAYDSEAKLWKRMGLAVTGCGDGLHDHRQGNPGKSATAEDWTAEGYNKARRSQMWTIGDSMIKTAGPYRDIYLRRKAYEIARAEALGLTVAPAAKIPKKDAAHYRSAMHVHRRAQRYMEKRLLRHLWRAWHRKTAVCGTPPQASLTLPAFDANTTGGGQHAVARTGHPVNAASDLIQPLGEAAT